MRVLVMRARADAEQTAERLAALGHDAILAPVLDLVPMIGAQPSGSFDGTVATSAHAFAAGESLAQAPREKPLFAVGHRTAAAAASAGFSDLRCCGKDAASLAALLAGALGRPASVLYLAGCDRKPTLEAALSEAGLSVTVHETYKALGAESWSDGVLAALRADRVDAGLHFSRRSATLALDLAKRHDVLAAFLGLRHFCLSDDVAAPLRRFGASLIEVAPQPDTKGLLSLLDRTANR